MIAAGAPLNAKNVYQNTPLSIAVRDGRDGIVPILRSAGATEGNASAAVPEGDYLGRKAPGTKAEMFAPGIVSTEKSELNSVFMPDGNELYFTIRNAQGRWTIMVMARTGSRWTAPRPASFSGTYSDVDLFISPDGRKLLYCSNRAPDGKGEPRKDFDIWAVDRVGADWSAPQSLGAPVNSEANEFYPALTGDGTLYFQSQRPGGLGAADIYRAVLRDGAYREAENIGSPINSPGFEGDCLVSPDESFPHPVGEPPRRLRPGGSPHQLPRPRRELVGSRQHGGGRQHQGQRELPHPLSGREVSVLYPRRRHLLGQRRNI